ncbi:hypothetical protein [Brevundimonas sp.]|uniref:hypothetical protein n=1 Tax=Brevundimonas sp. TaxID=1871086 RepID=UPI0028B267F9|nr:hypothetical protein [Brevundimonas sp.]
MKPGDYVYDPRADVNDYPKKVPDRVDEVERLRIDLEASLDRLKAFDPANAIAQLEATIADMKALEQDMRANPSDLWRASVSITVNNTTVRAIEFDLHKVVQDRFALRDKHRYRNETIIVAVFPTAEAATLAKLFGIPLGDVHRASVDEAKRYRDECPMPWD